MQTIHMSSTILMQHTFREYFHTQFDGRTFHSPNPIAAIDGACTSCRLVPPATNAVPARAATDATHADSSSAIKNLHGLNKTLTDFANHIFFWNTDIIENEFCGFTCTNP